MNVVLKAKHVHTTASVFLCFLFHFGIYIGFCFASCVSTLIMHLVSTVSGVAFSWYACVLVVPQGGTVR